MNKQTAIGLKISLYDFMKLMTNDQKFVTEEDLKVRKQSKSSNNKKLRYKTNDDMDKDITSNFKLIYHYICEISSWGNGRCEKDRETIMDDLGIKVSTIDFYTSKLREKGYILKVGHYKSFANKSMHHTFIYPIKHLDKIFYKDTAQFIRDEVKKEVKRIKDYNEVKRKKAEKDVSKCNQVDKEMDDILKTINGGE